MQLHVLYPSTQDINFTRTIIRTPRKFFFPFFTSPRLFITQLPEQGSYPVVRGGKGGMENQQQRKRGLLGVKGGG